MKMEVEIISEECIKPSSPTPHHLKNHKLSLLDLYILPSYIPLVLYYPFNQDTKHSFPDIDNIVSIRLQLLKQSLSETLSRFYPLAGRIQDLHSIDCNDDGVYFVKARAKSPLNEFLGHPDVVLSNKFLPDVTKFSTGPIPGNYVAAVQVTTFTCGGIVIGAFVSHLATDGTALSSFFKSWAAAANKNIEESMFPKFDAASIFPPNDAYPKEVCMSALGTSYIKWGKYVARRFVVDGDSMAKLRVKATSSSVQNPTRVESVSALLGKRIMAALKSSYGSDKEFLLTHAVNLRRKVKPIFSEFYMGNFVWIAAILSKNEEAELDGLASQLREEINRIDGDFVNGLKGDTGLFNFLDAVKHEGETYTTCAADKIAFTSWCNLGIYDLDFGWGKPAWASVCGVADSMNFSNLIVLMDTKLGNGVEAWVYMREEDMAVLEVDKELLTFAAVDPSPLQQDNPVPVSK